MLYSFLMALFIINSILLVLIILIQQGKGNMGLGNMGGATQMLFGGTGGQDIFQKTTWVMGAIFMTLSFVLAVMKTRDAHSLDYNFVSKSQPISEDDFA